MVPGRRPISVADLGRRIEKQEIAPVYLLTGVEATLRKRAVALLQAAVVTDEAWPELALETVDAETTGLPSIVDLVRNLPLFLEVNDRPTRLVRVRNAEALSGSGVGPLEEYLESPVPSACLIFEAEKLDGRRAFTKALQKLAVVVSCDSPTRDVDIRRWIVDVLKGYGVSIDQDAADTLVQQVGANLSVLDHELEKITLYAGEGQRIRMAHLSGILGRSREHTVFELTDRLVEGDAGRAVTMLNRLIDDGEEPVRLLAMMAWIMRQLILAADLVAAGQSEKEAIRRLGGRWDQRRAMLTRGRQVSSQRLMSVLASCADVDRFVKGLRDGRPGADRHRPARGRLEQLCRQICTA